MNIYKILIITLFLFPILLFCDETVPSRWTYYDFYGSERIFYDSNGNFFSIKENFSLSETNIYSWLGINKHNSNQANIGDFIILSAFASEGKLWLLMQEDSIVTIRFFDNALSDLRIVIDSNKRYNVHLSSLNYSLIKLKEQNNDVFYVNIVGSLWKIVKKDAKYNVINISNNVFKLQQFSRLTKWNLVYLTDKDNIVEVYLVDTVGKQMFLGTVPFTDNMNVMPLKNYLSAINWTERLSAAFLTTFSLASNSIVANDWLSNGTLLINYEPNSDYLYAIRTIGNAYELYKLCVDDINAVLSRVILPVGFYSPLKLEFVNDLIFVIFENGVLSYDSNLELRSFDFINCKEFSDKDFTINRYEDYILLISDYSTLILKYSENSLWLLNWYIYNTYKIIIPIILILLALIFYRKYRNQKRLFDSVVDLPSSGFMFFINRAGKLIKTNESGKNILNITDNIPLKKQFSFYCNTDQTQELAELVDLGFSKRIHFEQKINIIDNNIQFEWLCSLIILRNITGRFRGVLLTGIDITKELERQILTNWAQLAHDMQTNLSTIRLNAEQMETINDDDANRKRKILHQIAILVHRIKDIVTVGRNDKLEKTLVNSVEFCNEIRDEFDDNIFSKIHFEMQISNFNFICDKPKLLRAVRNAIENGIKYMKEKGGTITISANKDIHNITISIKDTGIGMDEKTKNKILMPFFSTTRNTGGSGIGTMIMQRVAELHGGKLIIDSKLNEGTEIKFQIPDLSRRKI